MVIPDGGQVFSRFSKKKNSGLFQGQTKLVPNVCYNVFIRGVSRRWIEEVELLRKLDDGMRKIKD